MSATRVLRDRVVALSNSLDRAAGPDIYCSAAMVGITTAIAAYPTEASAFYGITPQRITGTNAEGDTGTFVSDLAPAGGGGGALPPVALNVGATVPPEGTKVVCHAAGGRWVFRYDGDGGGALDV